MDDLARTIWDKALALLSLRSHSRKELHDKLARRFSGAEKAIAQALEELERVELLNDRGFTEAFLHHLIQKSIGRLKIRAETHRRGLDPDAVEALLHQWEWDEEKSAQKALQEKEALRQEKDPRKRQLKLIHFLRSRGFRETTIYRLVKNQ